MTTEVKEDIKRAVDVLKKGGVILYPTDTIWGLGCDATNAEAIEKIYKIKNRAYSKSMITLVSDLGMLERTVDGIPEVAYQLIEFSTKPLTIIFDKGINVADNMVAEDGSLAVRITKEIISKNLCRSLGRPIVSTSANISGLPSPRCYNEIDEDIKKLVDYICVSGRNYPCGNASTIMRLSENGEFKIIRP